MKDSSPAPISAQAVSRRAVLGFGAAAAAFAVTGFGSTAQAAVVTTEPECLADLVGGNHG